MHPGYVDSAIPSAAHCGFCIWQNLTPLQAPDITDYLASGSFAEHGMSVCLGHVQR